MSVNENETTLEKKKKGRKPKSNNYFDLIIEISDGVVNTIFECTEFKCQSDTCQSLFRNAK